MGGGPDPRQVAAADSQRRLTDREIALGESRNRREEEQYAQIKPFAFSRLQNGLPFFDALMDSAGGVTKRAFAPQYAALNRQWGGRPDLPSGSFEAARQGIGESEARAFDDSIVQNLMANENAKAEAARLITGQQQIANPAQFFGLANQGNNSIMGANLAKPGMAGVIGGLASSVISKIPF